MIAGAMSSVLLGVGDAGESRLLEMRRPQAAASVSFGEQLRQALEYVNSLQVQANRSAEELVLGDLESLHRLLIDTEKARLSLQLTVQVANKVVEAYQELSRMQI